MTRSSPLPVRPVVLCILDGWGHRMDITDNAIAAAHTPVYDRLMAQRPFGLLSTSGPEVGLPDGQMGNSEVGHMNLGGGRVVLQDLPRINEAIDSGELKQHRKLRDLAAIAGQSGGTCHIMGLLSPGGVHSHQDHLAALAGFVSGQGVKVAVHGFLDGRDTPPRSAEGFVADFNRRIEGCSGARLATLTGRYFAMDRDQRWDRTAKAYEALVEARGRPAPTADSAIAAAYQAGASDEFLEPAILGDYAGMADGDVLIMANFRADRVRQLLAALVDPAFDGFARSRRVDFAATLGMVEYAAALSPYLPALFPPVAVENSIGEVVGRAGLRQLRIAETEKYAHVTFFFNGGREQAFEGEDRILVPSPKVATYDLQPEMSAREVTDQLIAALESGDHDLIVVNYANADMVGHTGLMAAAVQAVETIDGCLGRLMAAVTAAGGGLLVTADHGNIENMMDRVSGQPHTAHTTNRVPLILAVSPNDGVCGLGHPRIADGRLADVAPTVLQLMALPRPAEMTGGSRLDFRAGEELEQNHAGP